MQPTTRKDQFPSQVKVAAQNVADKAKDTASSVADTAREAAVHAGQAIRDTAGTVGRKAEDWTATAGHKVESLGDTVRHQGPNSGVLGKATEGLAEGLESVGGYMSDKNLSGMMGDVTNLIKRNPIPALLLGLGIGYILGKSLRS
jgi:hypothetical protein